MNVIITSFGSGGFLYPALAVARELDRRGHGVRIATGSDALPILEAVGCEPLLREGPGQTQAFDVSLWSRPEAIVLQRRALQRGMERFACDALVAHPLLMGAALASELADVPLAQLGSAIALWRPSTWLFDGFCDRYAQAREASGLPACSARAAHWMGAAHLVRGVPELEPDGPALPEAVAYIGQCELEPQSDDAALARWLDHARVDDRPIALAHLGRSFGAGGALRMVAEACAAEQLALLAATDRTDDDGAALPGACFAAPHISHALAVPRCAAVISGGHPSSVVAALAHGLPLVLLPSGSGTVELAAACERAGAGVVVRERDRSPAAVRAALRTVLGDRALRDRARTLHAAFARYDGPAAACDRIERLYTGARGARTPCN